MASRIPAIEQDILTLETDGSSEAILVGGPAWFDWLLAADRFRYDGPAGHFTARREPASHGRGGTYWKGYRRSGGKLRRTYLGASARLSADRLSRAAGTLAATKRPATRTRPSAVLDEPDQEARRTAAGESPTRVKAYLRLLGGFELTDGSGNAVTIGSTRAQSLLSYLVLRRDVAHSRREIAFLLWPDASEAQALNRLRQLLHQLRQSWSDADAFLSTPATTLVLRIGGELQVDIDEYERAVAGALAADQASDSQALRIVFERAEGLYHEDLLPGSDDEWIIPERERLRASHERLLDRLIALLEEQGDYRSAVEYGQRRLRLDPLDERVCRSLMHLHVLNQDRAGAIRVYQSITTLLEQELGVEPDAETRMAYEWIAGLNTGASDAVTASSGSTAQTGLVVESIRSSEAIPFVGRQDDWARIMAAWRRMTDGEAHFVLIGGPAGIGKSRLVAELCDWAGHQGIKPARTRAYAAEGRLPYAPVADWLRSPILAAALPRLDLSSLSEISRLLPELLTHRPDLPRPSARVEDWQRQPFFQALARAFLIADRPLLLVLDDLQWCDADTLEWLHFLLRFDRRARLVVAGTVRSDELDRRHPLVRVVAELRHAAQITEIELGPLDPSETSALAAHVAGRRLRPAQARHIHLETEGNPLFVVETVRAGLSDPGLETAEAGFDRPPALRSALATRRLPPRVQAVIAARLGQLSEPAHALAAAAATVGRAFTLELARVSSGVSDEVLVNGLDELLDRQVVREQGNGVYDFAHDKIREVAYGELTEARRRLLHRRVAEGLERLQAAALDPVAAQIAAHYASAGMADRAAGFYQRAAEVAQRVGADQEAIDLLQRGLTLLETLPPSLDRDAREVDLRTALGVSLVATRGYGASEVAAVYARCRQLCHVLGRPPSPPILRALALASLAAVDIEQCHALGDHLLSLADRDNDPVLQVEAHYVIAMALLLSGSAGPARAELEASLAHYDRARAAVHIGLYSQDPGVICRIRLSLDLWMLGEPEEATRRRAESLALAEELGHPFTLAYALTWDAVLQAHRGVADAARTQADAALRLAREHRLPFWLGFGTVIHGWAVAEQGDIEGGIDEIRTGMAAFAATGARSFLPFQLALLAEQHGRLGNIERGLTLIAEALALVERTNERWAEAELFRRKGDLLEAVARDDEADAAYRRAIGVAQHQGTRAVELRSATRLADLCLRHDRATEVATILQPIVRRFRGTTDLSDLDRARALLRRIGAAGNRPDA